MLQPPRTTRIQNSIVELDKGLIMGIINATDDSFYAPSRVGSVALALEKARQMVVEGAHILDIGGQSTRPGAALISPETECQRVVPVIEAIAEAMPDVFISIDTFRPEVADAALKAGAHIVNDVTGGQHDPDIWQVAANHNATYVCMHSRGTPANMQNMTNYDDVVETIFDYFTERLAAIRNARVYEIWLDCGFGFAKTLEQNYQIVKNMHTFEALNCPLLVGISRKSMICKLIDTTPEDVLPATAALHYSLLDQGGRILRVHDVAAARQVLQVWHKTARHERKRQPNPGTQQPGNY